MTINKDRIWLWMGMLVTASLYFGFRFPSYTIALTGLWWLASGSFKETWQHLKENPAHFISWYWMVWVAMTLLWTQDLLQGGKVFETRLSFLLLPLIFFHSGNPFQKYRVKWLQWHVILSLVTMAICVAHSVFLYYDEIRAVAAGEVHDTYININFFYASYLSYFMHPGYYAMLLCGAMVALFELYFRFDRFQGYRFSWLLMLQGVFTLFIFYLTSKTGILLAGAVWSYYFIRWLRFSPYWKWGVFGAIAGVGLVLVVVMRDPVIRSRFTYLLQAFEQGEDVDPASKESTAVRMMIWKASWTVGSANWFSGVGIGDVNSALQEEYTRREMTGALDANLNTHNQYLQTYVEGGLPGVLLLLFMLWTWLSNAWRNRDRWLIWLWLILFFNMFTESVLQTQAGVLFMSFFMVMALSHKQEEENAYGG